MADDLSDAYPDLAHLFGAYLNQDYDIYGPTLEDAVRAFVADDPPECVMATRLDIARFLHDHPDDADAALDALDAGRSQEPEMSGRDYLLWLDRILADALASASAQGHAAE
jgi:hypothetical protein